MNTRRTGFTLIEMMIVVGIIGILVAALSVGLTRWVRSAQKSNAQAAVSDARTALEALFIKKDSTWPPAILNARTHEGGFHVMDEKVAIELFRNNLGNVDCKKTADQGGLDDYTLRGADRCGIADPWAREVLKNSPKNGDKNTKVPSGGKVEDHLIYFAVDQNGDGIVDKSEGAPVKGVRARVITWCAGADGGLGDCSTDKRSKAKFDGRTVSNGDNVYSWQRDQEER